jgi:hypothetical protein
MRPDARGGMLVGSCQLDAASQRFCRRRYRSPVSNDGFGDRICAGQLSGRGPSACVYQRSAELRFVQLEVQAAPRRLIRKWDIDRTVPLPVCDLQSFQIVEMSPFKALHSAEVLDVCELTVQERTAHAHKFVEEPCLDRLQLAKNLWERRRYHRAGSCAGEQPRPSRLHSLVVFERSFFEYRTQ